MAFFGCICSRCGCSCHYCQENSSKKNHPSSMLAHFQLLAVWEGSRKSILLVLSRTPFLFYVVESTSIHIVRLWQAVSSLVTPSVNHWNAICHRSCSWSKALIAYRQYWINMGMQLCRPSIYSTCEITMAFPINCIFSWHCSIHD